MLDWLLHNASKIVAAIVIVLSIVRSIRQSREGDALPPPPAGDLEQDRREREVRDKIRRRIRERQGGAPANAEPPQPILVQPVEPSVPSGAPPPRVATPAIDPRPVSVAAEVERQQRLADELRSIEEAKVLAARRAAHLAAEQTAAAQTTAALRRGARDELLSDLQTPSSLRRAFLLREVLGTPAGLR